jgi:hypothetical protein
MRRALAALTAVTVATLVSGCTRDPSLPAKQPAGGAGDAAAASPPKTARTGTRPPIEIQDRALEPSQLAPLIEMAERVQAAQDTVGTAPGAPDWLVALFDGWRDAKRVRVETWRDMEQIKPTARPRSRARVLWLSVTWTEVARAALAERLRRAGWDVPASDLPARLTHPDGGSLHWGTRYARGEPLTIWLDYEAPRPAAAALRRVAHPGGAHEALSGLPETMDGLEYTRAHRRVLGGGQSDLERLVMLFRLPDADAADATERALHAALKAKGFTNPTGTLHQDADGRRISTTRPAADTVVVHHIRSWDRPRARPPAPTSNKKSR